MTRTEEAQLRIIAELMTLEPPRVLFGGWAEDALLHGKPSRPHDDIDLLVPLAELDLLVQQLEALGFTDARVKFQVEEDRPIVVALYRDGIELELIVYQQEVGGAFFDLPVGDALGRLRLSSDAFTHAARLGDIAVRTLTPAALYQVREFCQDVFGGMRDKDRVTQAQLKACYFPHSNPSMA